MALSVPPLPMVPSRLAGDQARTQRAHPVTCHLRGLLRRGTVTVGAVLQTRLLCGLWTDLLLDLDKIFAKCDLEFGEGSGEGLVMACPGRGRLCLCL